MEFRSVPTDAGWRIITCLNVGRLFLIDPVTKGILRRFVVDETPGAVGLDLDRSGEFLAVGGETGGGLLRVSDGQSILSFPGNFPHVRILGFGEELVVGMPRRSSFVLRIADRASTKLPNVTGLAASTHCDHNRALLAPTDRKGRLVRIAAGIGVETITLPLDRVVDAIRERAETGEFLVLAGSSVYCFDPSLSEPRWSVRLRRPAADMCVTGDQRVLVVEEQADRHPNTLHLLDAATGERIGEMTGHALESALEGPQVLLTTGEVLDVERQAMVHHYGQAAWWRSQGV